MPSVSMQKAKKVKKHILDLYQTQQKTIPILNNTESLQAVSLKNSKGAVNIIRHGSKSPFTAVESALLSFKKLPTPVKQRMIISPFHRKIQNSY